MDQIKNKILFQKQKGLSSIEITNSLDTDVCVQILDFIEKEYNAKISTREDSNDNCLRLDIEIDKKLLSYYRDDLMDDAIYAKSSEANDLVQKIGKDLENFLR